MRWLWNLKWTVREAIVEDGLVLFLAKCWLRFIGTVFVVVLGWVLWNVIYEYYPTSLWVGGIGVAVVLTVLSIMITVDS